MHKIIFVQTHPIQYAAPLFKECTEAGLPIEVWFCEKAANRSGLDKKFGQAIKWDIPLLEGYVHRFFSNQSWKPSVESGFFGLLNLSILRELKKTPSSLVVVYGWNYATTLLLLLFAGRFGHKVALRGEAPITHEWTKPKWKLAVRRVIFGKFLFRRIDYAFYIGTRNKEFYQYYGVPDHKLKFTPYAVDNKRFRAAYEQFKNQKQELRVELGINPGKKMILFAGKFTDKKRPMDLLMAFHKLNDENAQVVFLGEGELRGKMEAYIKEFDLKNVIITGFINQSKIVKYYAAADVFVMCSGVGETWGLSVNEAMNFNLPVIVSDITGCSVDLVKNNGFIYLSGNIEELITALDTTLNLSPMEVKEFGEHSITNIKGYLNDKSINTLKHLTKQRVDENQYA